MDNGKILENIDIRIEGNRIAEIGENLKGDEKIDCSGRIIMPGLVNTHTHAAMTFLRGFRDDLELNEWLREMWRVEARLTPEIVYAGSKLAIYEMLSTGTTAFIDMYFFPDETAKAAKELGIKAKLGPPILGLDANLDALKKEIITFAKNYERDELIKPFINVHSIYACPLEALDLSKNLSEELNLDIQIHVSETRKEVFDCKKKYGVFPVELLEKRGFLSERVQMVHLGWITSWEIGLIRKRNAKVTHCPTSNMKLATAGFFPFKEMHDMGITIGLGTDGAASNNCLDMFREMKNAVLLQRNNYWNTDLKAYHVLQAATVNGAKIFGINSGKIAPGYLADLIIINPYSPNLQPIRNDNLISNIVYSAIGTNVEITIVNGKIVYDSRNREQIERIREEIKRIGEKINEFIVQEH